MVRTVRTVFDYENAPYSNMVNGEVINHQGSWSSYTPHSHPQPEVYYYRFQREEGFGACFIGDNAYKPRPLAATVPEGQPRLRFTDGYPYAAASPCRRRMLLWWAGEFCEGRDS